MKERLVAGASFEVSSTVNLKGKLSESNRDGKEFKTSAIWASANSRYRERILDVSGSAEVALSARRYVTAGLEKETGEIKQRIALRPGAERVLIQRTNQQSTIFSPDAPLKGAELDLLQADAFTPELNGLLPAKPVKKSDRWQASPIAASELTGISPIQQGALICTLIEVKSTSVASVARIQISGSLTGPSDQGPTRMTVDGHFLFDLDTQVISYVHLNGRTEILDEAGKVVGQLEGRYELHRRPAIDDPRLSESALTGIVRKPNAQNTALLFEASDQGIRFLYPRNWELTSVARIVVQLEEPTGGSMRLTIDADPAPTTSKLRSDLLSWLNSQQATVKDASPVQSISLSNSRKADRFTVRAELGTKEKEWTYVVLRSNARSVTVAANLVGDRADALRADIQSVASSLEFLAKP